MAGSKAGDPLPRQVAAISLGLLLASSSVEIGGAIIRLASASAGGHEVHASLARSVEVLLRLERAQAQAALDPLLTAIKGTTDRVALEALAQAVQALAAKLTEVQAQAALDPLLTAIKGTTDGVALWALAQAYQALAAKLTYAQAQAALDPLLTAIKGTTNP